MGLRFVEEAIVTTTMAERERLERLVGSEGEVQVFFSDVDGETKKLWRIGWVVGQLSR